MFHVNRGGDHRIYHNNNSAPATLKLLGFVFVVGLVGGTAWAAMLAVRQVTTAMGRTWTPGNNDHLISGWNTLVIVGGLVSILLITLVILPYLIRNFMQALAPPSRSRGDDWGFDKLSHRPLPELVEGEPSFGLLVDGKHEESFIDV